MVEKTTLFRVNIEQVKLNKTNVRININNTILFRK